ncbi:methionyl-tRNA formyltransferase [Spiroplasma chinense]|uniref:Methionyl-tRNA formyltransferase n=1 Tax=Spiroplasma chinense TaxID=216932 RepID=A0A5B9Y3P9_9MOLU|nr:methionyl-tRNA formyltransferase [Spiroplasma chinense]QEH61694.1 methionyl-tRNA formyltransferase [Spiroplasma chinense]
MKYKVIFCGTPPIAVEILKGLESLEVEIVGVISQPDRMVGRKKEITYPPVKQYALEKGYKVLQPQKVGEAFEEIKSLEADFMITCAFGQFIPQKVLDLFKNSINVHASLLPKYRGGSPIHYAIMNGEKETGISLMKMIKKMDAGEVYAQESLEILNTDDNGSLFEKMGVLGKNMIQKYLMDIFENKLVGVEQDETKVTFAYNLPNEQEKIDWQLPSENIHNFIRALSPKPIAFSLLGEERIKIKKSELVDLEQLAHFNSSDFENGQIVLVDKKGMLVKTVDGFLRIVELQRSGKKMSHANTFNISKTNEEEILKFI